MSDIPRFLHKRLSEVVSLTLRPPYSPRNIPGTNSFWRLSQLRGHNATRTIISIEKSDDLIGNRTCDIPSCSEISQPLTLQRSTDIIFM
jgi:hypothetical protein